MVGAPTEVFPRHKPGLGADAEVGAGGWVVVMAMMAVAVAVGWLVILSVVLVRMIAVNDVGRHKAVDDAGHDLHAHKAQGKAANHEQAGHLVGLSIVGEVPLGRRQHAVEGGEDLDRLAARAIKV